MDAARLMRWSFRAALAALGGAYMLGMGVTGAVVGATKDLPELSQLLERTRPVSVRFQDRYGRDLVVRGASEAGELDASDLPPHLVDAVLAVEDRRFAHHIGVDAEAILRAFVRNWQTGRRGEGGSTLTQQLAKNVFLTPDKTYRRKVQEALLAVWMERIYTKEEVLEMYLERVYFGSGTWGLSAASRHYFDRAPEELTLAESAVLAGLLKAPSRYNPAAHPRRAGERAALVLEVMEGQSLVSRAQRAEALAEPLRVRPPEGATGVNHFVDWVWSDLEGRLGVVGEDIVVRTTLDRDVQRSAESAVHAHLDAERGAEEAALVTVDRDGGVLAMVGGASYSASQFNRATQARRQPGSSFKPFVYLAAWEAGLDPWTVRDDAPVEIDGWKPENFGGEHVGAITLEAAFARSTNTVAVSLAEEVGRDTVVATAERMGLRGMLPLRSLPLGAQGVSPLELAGAYLPFAAGGYRSEPFGVLDVRTASGLQILGTEAAEPERVVGLHALAHTNRSMVSAVEIGTGRRARVQGREVGGKTGTTDDHRDAWFAGYAPGVATVVWMGNDANSPMDEVTGGSLPARVFSEHMGRVLEGRPDGGLLKSSPPLGPARVAERTGLEALLADAEAALPDGAPRVPGP